MRQYLSSSIIILLSICHFSSCGNQTKVKSTDPSAQTLPGVPAEVFAEANAMLFGGEKGEGGDAVVCFSNRDIQRKVKEQLGGGSSAGNSSANPFQDAEVKRSVSKVELLDLYEYRLPSGFPPVSREIMAIDQSFDKMIPIIIERLSAKSGLGDQLRQTLAEMPMSNWRQALGVIEINDSAHAFLLPPECLLIQAAVRRDNQVFYDVNLWELMNEESRTALVLHELVYKIAVDKHHHSTSQKSREIVGLILSKSELPRMDGWEIQNLIKSIGDYKFSWRVEENDLVVLDVVSNHLDGSPKEILVDSKPIITRNHQWLLAPGLEIRNSPNLTLKADRSIDGLLGTLPGTSSFTWKNNMSVSFNSSSSLNFVAKMFDSNPSCADLSIDSKYWGCVKEATFVAGFLTAANVYDFNPPIFKTRFGSTFLSGIVKLNSTGKVPLYAETVRVQIFEAGFEMDGVYFDQPDQIIPGRLLASTYFSIDISNAFEQSNEFDLDIKLYSGTTYQWKFTTDGKFSAVFSETLSSFGLLLQGPNSRVDVSGIESITVNPEKNAVLAKTGRNGRLEDREIPDRTVRINRDGSVDVLD